MIQTHSLPNADIVSALGGRENIEGSLKTGICSSHLLNGLYFVQLGFEEEKESSQVPGHVFLALASDLENRDSLQLVPGLIKSSTRMIRPRIL